MVCISVLPWRQSVITSLPSESRVQKVCNSWPFYSLLLSQLFFFFLSIPFLFFSFLATFLTMLRNQEMSNMRWKIVIRIKKWLMQNFGCSIEEKVNVMTAEERLVWHLTCAYAWKVRGESSRRSISATQSGSVLKFLLLWLKQHFFNVLLALTKIKFGRIKAGFLSIYLQNHLLIKGTKRREQKSARVLCDKLDQIMIVKFRAWFAAVLIWRCQSTGFFSLPFWVLKR